MMIGHRRCGTCQKIGHKKDMVYGEKSHNIHWQVVGFTELKTYDICADWYHVDCLKAKGIIRCACGNGWTMKKKPTKRKK